MIDTAAIENIIPAYAKFIREWHKLDRMATIVATIAIVVGSKWSIETYVTVSTL